MRWLFILITGLSFAEDPPFDRKDELIVKVIKGAADYHHIKDILDIIKPSRHYRYIPSINPLNPKNIRRISSRYGMRFHPIEGKYKGRKMKRKKESILKNTNTRIWINYLKSAYLP